jgi:ribonuclease G
MEPDLVERTVRDFLTEDIDRVLIDNKADYERTQDLVSLISQRSRSKIAFYKDSIPIFERFNIERQIEQTFQRKVAAALRRRDRHRRDRGPDRHRRQHRLPQEPLGRREEHHLRRQPRGGPGGARQIRLRNLGGLIIIDFIDMKERRHRNAVYEKMVELMSEDKAKNHILPISQLGIMQMTRQRQQESLSSNLYTDCPYCHGRGIVKSATTMSVELQRRLSSVVRRLHARKDGKEYSLRVLVHPAVLERLRSEDADLLVRMEKSFRREARLPRRPELPRRELQDHQRADRRGLPLT